MHSPDQRTAYTYLRDALTLIGVKRGMIAHEARGRFILVITVPNISGCITVRDEREELFCDVVSFTGWRASYHTDITLLNTVYESERIYGRTYADDAASPIVSTPVDSAQCAGAIHRWIVARSQ